MIDLHEIWYNLYVITCNTRFEICNVRFAVITGVLLEFHVFWDAILYRWVRISRLFEKLPSSSWSIRGYIQSVIINGRHMALCRVSGF
jgi:hypothetical protein